jgi:hypothetical protein
VSQLKLFATATLGQPARLPARVLIAGVDAELEREHALPGRVIRVDRNLGIRFVGEDELAAAEIEPAFWLAPIAPGAPDRRVLFETLANEVVEQDEAGAIWVDDQRLLPAGLVSFGAAESQREGTLAIGEAAALLLMERQPGGCDLRVRVTPAILWIHALPRPLADGPVLDGWLEMAERALHHVRATA